GMGPREFLSSRTLGDVLPTLSDTQRASLENALGQPVGAVTRTLFRGDQGSLPSGRHLASFDETTRFAELTGRQPAQQPQLATEMQWMSESHDIAEQYA